MPQSVPVCMFHHVNENEKDFITVSVENFKNMMAMLHREGYTTLSSEEFRRYKLGIEKVPRRSVMLTFDDAWLDIFVHAFPVMQCYGHKFTVFVISDLTERASRYPRTLTPTKFPKHNEAISLADSPRVSEVVCNWEDLRTMMESGLCSIENHTASHGATSDVRSDIEKGRRAIQTALGVPANQLCWPRGKHDAPSMAIARELGIDVTYLVRRGVNLPGLWTMRIKRFTVKDEDSQWLKRNIEIFSRPVYGYLYSRIKPDRLKKKWFRWESADYE
jgi:peptidoglycan/xylan/chitin deacetylase (PgdA/CDA1 family)